MRPFLICIAVPNPLDDVFIKYRINSINNREYHASQKILAILLVTDEKDNLKLYKK